VSTSERLTQLYRSAKEIPFGNTSKFIILSDCHRGDNSWADDFAPNQHLLFHALNYYYQEGFCYIEIGDGDELLENKRFEDIRSAHSHVFWILSKLHAENRLHLLWGNHDIERRDPSVVKSTLYHYYHERTRREEPLFEGIQVREALVLKHAYSGRRILLVHGHQGDLLADQLWWVGGFFVRHFWRHLQLLGVRDPTSPARNVQKQIRTERRLVSWCRSSGQALIAGHTHRPRFPLEGGPLYFNGGSCVHPRCITGLEIIRGEIALIKWAVTTTDSGAMRVVREVLVGPKRLDLLWQGASV